MKAPTTASEAVHNLSRRDCAEVELKKIKLQKAKTIEEIIEILNPEKSSQQ